MSNFMLSGCHRPGLESAIQVLFSQGIQNLGAISWNYQRLLTEAKHSGVCPTAIVNSGFRIGRNFERLMQKLSVFDNELSVEDIDRLTQIVAFFEDENVVSSIRSRRKTTWPHKGESVQDIFSLDNLFQIQLLGGLAKGFKRSNNLKLSANQYLGYSSSANRGSEVPSMAPKISQCPLMQQRAVQICRYYQNLSDSSKSPSLP